MSDIEMPVINQMFDSLDSQLDINRTSNSVSFLKLSPQSLEDDETIISSTNSNNYLNTDGNCGDANDSPMWKRQSYRTVAIRARHLLRQDSSPGAGQPLSSFDSIDTIETSSTDRSSRLDQVTTSFESSATDSTTGGGIQETRNDYEGEGVTPAPGGGNSNRMLQTIRGDSGYRSMESTSTPRLSQTLAANFSLSQDNLDDCQCQNKRMHDEKCERNKPVVFARCTRYGLAKSRPSVSPTSPLAAAETAVMQQQQQQPSASSAGWKQRVQRAQTTTMTRDYSIDEKTDAIFREFSRCDPVYDSTKTQSGSFSLASGRRAADLRHTMGRNRWISQQHNHYYPQQHRFLSLQTDLVPADENCALNE